jgi:pantoate--beta-alanine ligase
VTSVKRARDHRISVVGLEQVTTIPELRRWCDSGRAAGATIGLVPTMGYLHAGHLSLAARARTENDVVVVTIFVNPLQFGPNEDLDRYPSDLAHDLRVCEEAGVDRVFTPAPAEMYPRPPLTTVHVAGLTEDLCGAARPTHFDGVTTVVTKLFSIVGACRAYFGRKDAQQLAVVRRMVADLDIPVDVVGCPLVREPDGLALSSRNAYLTPEERATAPVLSRALEAAGDAITAGERDARKIRNLVESTVASEPAVELEYVELRDAHELRPLSELDGEVLLALAARLGATRLIDNIGISIRGTEVDIDHGQRLAG